MALTVPSHSGSGGASPYRFIFGKAEQLHNAAGAFPHWFRPGFAEFVERPRRRFLNADIDLGQTQNSSL